MRQNEYEQFMKMAEERNKLREEVKRLRQALEFYADKENWNEGDMELGDRARKALQRGGE